MTDDELTDSWQAVLGRSLSHEEHLRIAYTLIQRHGRDEARVRLLVGTKANCDAMSATDRFDAELTTRWSNHLADLIAAERPASLTDLLDQHEELRRGNLLGLPNWKRQ